MSSETVITGTSIWRPTRSAVRWRVPVSEVGMLGSGTRCTLARATREQSDARMIAPSIFASSESRCGVNSASSRKPPEQTDEDVGTVADDDRARPCGPAGCGRGPRAAGVPGRHQPQGDQHRFRSRWGGHDGLYLSVLSPGGARPIKIRSGRADGSRADRADVLRRVSPAGIAPRPRRRTSVTVARRSSRRPAARRCRARRDRPRA